MANTLETTGGGAPPAAPAPRPRPAVPQHWAGVAATPAWGADQTYTPTTPQPPDTPPQMPEWWVPGTAPTGGYAPGMSPELQGNNIFSWQQEQRDRQTAASAEQQKAEEATARDRASRASALVDMVPGQNGSYRMTWAEYNALTPEQQHAVDFNTMLVQAVRKDRQSQDVYGTPSTSQQSSYDAALTKAFGSTERGSRVYAPETLGLLNQIGYTDKNSDLDDFLKLRTAITTEDLQLLPASTGIGVVNGTNTGPVNQAQNVLAVNQLGPTGDVLALKRSLASSTGEMEAALLKGNEMIAGTTQQAANAARYDITRDLGGTQSALGFGLPNWLHTPGGLQPADLNTVFLDAFDKLANTANAGQSDAILKAVKSEVEPQEFETFMNYLQTRSANPAAYGQPLNPDAVTYLSPQEFRRQIGLDSAQPADTQPREQPPTQTAPQTQMSY